MLADYLGTSGYVVLDCTSADMAANRFREAHGAIDLLITGVTETVSLEMESGIQFWKDSSNLKFILLSTSPSVTWSASNAAFHSQIPKDSVIILQEPFSVLDLLLSVNELIGVPDAAVVHAAGGA